MYSIDMRLARSNTTLSTRASVSAFSRASGKFLPIRSAISLVGETRSSL